MKKLVLMISVLFSSLLLSVFLGGEDVRAQYSGVCIDSSLSLSNGFVRRCGNKNIYVDMENKDKSSYFVSTNSAFSPLQTLYVGKVDGIDTFYSYGFAYFGYVYDDGSMKYHKGDYWTSISVDGVRIYDGKFDDDWWLNNTREERRVLYNQKGEYLIHQYANGTAYRTIRVIVVSEKDYDMTINSVKYGDKVVGKDSLIGNKGDLVIDIAKNKYGYEKKVNVSVNSCELDVVFNNNLVIENRKFSSCLNHNDTNKISITLYNGFGNKKTFKYSFKLASEKITIKLENSVSEMV